MCGIVGLWGPLEGKAQILAESCHRIRLRGPDSKGFWEDGQAGVAFGHVRLAIQDLTEAGHQPMVSACGRYILTYNGEVYNHLEMRAELEKAGHAPAWRGHSDTETILAYAAAFGVEAMLRAAVGMWAIALWDRQTRSLTLARDRMGEKPLYYGYVGATLVFSSQLKGLSPVPGFGRTIDRNALASFMRHNYVPAPQSIYEGIRKLPAASWVVISEAQLGARDMPAPQAYWSAMQVADAGQRQPRQFATDNEAADALQAVLTQAVRGQMISDVSLGAFLSGGIDSSTIAALMQSQSNVPVRTFAIGFHEKEYDEAPHAKAVATHLGTDHAELYVTAQDALDVVPGLADIYDEPFADSSQIPTALVTRMARQHVTVAFRGAACRPPVRSHDEAGHDHLSARRHSGQGGPRGHGREPGDPGAAHRSPRLRVRLEPAVQVQGAGGHGQVAAAPGAAPPCAAEPGRAAQARLCRAAGGLAARAAARLGRGAAGSGAPAPARLVRTRAHIAQMARASERPPQMGQPSVGRADDAGLAGSLSPRRRAMKIVLAVSSMNAGGAERVAATLANAWAARGDQVTLLPTFSGGGSCFYPLAPEVELLWLARAVPAGGALAPLKRLLGLRRLVRARRPDVLVSFLTNVNVGAILATRGLGQPLIVCERTNPVVDTTTGKVWRRLRRWLYPLADVVTVQAEDTVAPFAAQVPGIRHLAVIPNPLPAELLDAPLAALAPDAQGRRRLMAMGRLVPDKQFGLLIDLFAELAPAHPDWDLWIWGEGPQRQALEARVAQLGLRQRIRLPGRTSEPWEALSQSSAFVLSSAVEGFPNVLLEAMAKGLPCAAFDCPSGPREMTRDGADALLLREPAAMRDALGRLMSDAALREELGRRGARSVRERYALSKVLAQWDDLFALARR